MQSIICTENSSFQGLYQHAWDSTSLGTLKECPYKYFLKLICGWEKAQRADALVFGIAFHSAMQIFHYKYAEGQDYEASLKAALRAAISDYTTEDGEIHVAEKKERNLYSLLRAVCWYLDHWYDCGRGSDPATTLILPSGKPAAELSFRFTFPDLETPDGEQVLVCGHIDRIAKHGGTPFVNDYKTTGGALNSRFFDGFSPDNQMSLYDFAGSVILQEKIGGVIVDGVKLNVHSTEFGRGFAPRTQEQREEFMEDFKFWVQLSWHFADTKHWPMNEKACGNYGGCEFRDVCNKPASLREGFLKSKFRRRVWDPLQSRELEAGGEAKKVIQ